MYNRGKYITGEILSGSMEVYCAVCFPETVNHTAVSNVFIEGTIQGAGFFSINSEGKLELHGESVGLRIGRHEMDHKHVSRALGLPVTDGN